MNAATSNAEAPSVDGQDHDRMEGTATDTSVTIDDQRGNRPDRNHSASGIDIVGQAHDRIDAEMGNNGALPNGNVPEASAISSSGHPDNDMSEELMDTTPDNPLVGMLVLADEANPSIHPSGILPKLSLFQTPTINTLTL